MIYLYALPVVLATTALTSATWQQMFEDFVDLRRVERQVLLVAIAWSLGGWLLESKAGERAAELYVRCETKITTQMAELEETVFDLVGGF